MSTLFLSLCVIALGLPDGPPPGYDAGSFVRELARHGYNDLAEMQLKRYEADTTLSAADKESLSVARSQIAMTRAAQLTGKEKIAALVEAYSAAQLQAVQKQGTPGGELAEEVVDQIGESLAETYVQGVLGAANPTEAAAMRTEAIDFLTKEANRNYDDVADLKKKGQLTEQEDTALMLKRYAVPRLYWQQARLLEDSAPEKVVKLKDAITALQEYQLDYSSVVMGYQAYNLMGQVFKELGKIDPKSHDEALSAFNDAVNLKEEFKDPAGRYNIDNESALGVIVTGSMEKSKLLQELKRYDEAIKVIDDLLAAAPELKATRQGLNAQTVKLEALRDAGKTDEAMKLANAIAEADRGGPAGNLAQRILSEFVATGGAGKMDTRTLEVAAARAIKVGEFGQAFVIYRNALRMTRDPKQRTNFLLQMGRCQSQLGNLEEAALAYDTAAMTSTEDDAADAAYNAALIYSKLSGQTGAPFYDKRAENGLRLLSSRFPSSPRAASAQYLVGAKLERAGRLEEAAKAYLGVPENASRFEAAQYQAGDCYVQLATDAKTKKEDKDTYIKNAEDALKKCLARIADKRKAGPIDENLTGVDYSARTLLGRIYLAAKPPKTAEVLALLDSVDKDFADDPVKLTGAKVLSVQGMIQENKLAEATDLMGVLIQRAPKDPGVIDTARNLAVALDGVVSVDKPTWTDKKLSLESARLACAQFYRQYASRTPKDAKDRRRIEEAADRMESIGMRLANLDEKDDTFARFKLYQIANPQPFEWAIDAYTKVEQAETDADARVQLNLKIGRATGLLKRYVEAVQAYESMFAEDPVINVDGSLDSAALQRKRYLLKALVELAFGYTQLPATPQTTNQALRYVKAVKPYLKLAPPGTAAAAASSADDQLYWVTRVSEIEALMKRGQGKDYQTADVLWKEMERASPGFDANKFGAADKMKDLRKQIDGLLGGKK
jgi:hypothetical protein